MNENYDHEITAQPKEIRLWCKLCGASVSQTLTAFELGTLSEAEQDAELRGHLEDLEFDLDGEHDPECDEYAGDEDEDEDEYEYEDDSDLDDELGGEAG